MQKVARSLVVAALCVGGGAVGWAQQPRRPARPAGAGAVKSVASVLDIMKAMTIPMSEVVFKAGSEPPKDAAGWEAVRLQAAALAEAGTLLTIGARVRDRGDWLTFARAQVDKAELAAKAAAAKDAEALEMASNDLYEACDTCHKKYLPK